MSVLQEAVQRIRKVGINNVRVTPTTGSKSIIEILENNGWVQILNEMETKMAEDVLRQATSKLILG